MTTPTLLPRVAAPSDPSFVANPRFPLCPASIPDRPLVVGRYEVRFARHPDELEAVQRLRYEVFNLELGEGLEESHGTGRDADEFDAASHHLLVVERESDTVIGTYRLATREMADAGHGFYSAGEFDLSRLPREVTAEGVEIGRACIAREHRKQRVLFALWRGLARYLSHNRKRFLFGCCSLTSQDPREAARVMRHLELAGHVHPVQPVQPLPEFACVDATEVASVSDTELEGVSVPALFAAYLRYRAKVYGPPAIDRRFKTIDYFVVCDTGALDSAARATFFAD